MSTIEEESLKNIPDEDVARLRDLNIEVSELLRALFDKHGFPDTDYAVFLIGDNAGTVMSSLPAAETVAMLKNMIMHGEHRATDVIEVSKVRH